MHHVFFEFSSKEVIENWFALDTYQALISIR